MSSCLPSELHLLARPLCASAAFRLSVPAKLIAFVSHRRVCCAQLPHYPGLMDSMCERTGLKPSFDGRERTHCVHGRRDRGRFREANPLQKRHLAESGPAAQSPLCSPRPQGTNRAEKFSSFFAAKGGLWRFCQKQLAYGRFASGCFAARRTR